MKNILLVLLSLSFFASYADFRIKIPLEVHNGGNLPENSIQLGDGSGSAGNGGNNNNENCYEDPSVCFGEDETYVNECSFERQASQYGDLPYAAFWFESVVAPNAGDANFAWESYMISGNVNGGGTVYNNPEGGTFYRGRFIENMADSFGGNYYEGRTYEVCYYGPEWVVEPY